MTSPTPEDVAQATEPTTRHRRSSSPKVAKGALVTYRHTDPITGQELEGAGLALTVPDEGGAITIAPLSPELLEVDPANVFAVDQAEG